MFKIQKLTGGIMYRKILYIKNIQNLKLELEEQIIMHQKQNSKLVGDSIEITKILLPEKLVETLGSDVSKEILGIPVKTNYLQGEYNGDILLINDFFCMNNLGIDIKYMYEM